jgi:hypothetical protein
MRLIAYRCHFPGNLLIDDRPSKANFVVEPSSTDMPGLHILDALVKCIQGVARHIAKLNPKRLSQSLFFCGPPISLTEECVEHRYNSCRKTYQTGCQLLPFFQC